jgi:CDP-glycerol glycerophosphotransferase
VPGQRFLEVFHGYPAKSIGVQLWESKQFTPRRIERMLRTSRDWDLILTPVPEIDAVYRTEYRYQGAILSEGYPRDDLLLSPDADRVRAETRRRLGIRDDQTVVLYAPTWRDDLATNPRAAALVAHLDVESAGEALGDGYVLLLRGHRFHPRSTQQRAARWMDVGDYPEVNDLILASDVGVFDYSSIRFDFALTRRPMIFLVPDLDRYSGSSRGFLFDFADSAPGPLLDTQEEVVEQLRDVEGLRRRYAEQVERFVTTYQYRQDDHSAQRVVDAFFTG